MSVMDHYQSRKKRNCENNKTPSSSVRNVQDDTTILHLRDMEMSMNGKVGFGKIKSHNKDISHPRKRQRNISPCVTISSDESSLEIHWDNNSPLPSNASHMNKTRRQAKNDICELLKHVPKKRKPDKRNVKDVKENHLKTWMQDSLAKECKTQTEKKCLVLKPMTRRSTGKRTCTKGEAVTFNEKIKQFLKQAVNDDTTDLTTEIKSSATPPSARMTEKRKTESPCYFSSSETDSLLLNFDTSHEESDDSDSTKIRKTPMRACKKKANKMDIGTERNVAEDNGSKHVQKIYKNNSKTGLKTVKRSPIDYNSKKLNTIPEVRNDIGKNDKTVDIEIEDDELDKILSTQEKLFDDNFKLLDKNKKSSFTKVQCQDKERIPVCLSKNMSNPMYRKQTYICDKFDLDNDDELMLNYYFFNNKDNFTFKSQEISTSTARLSSNQRVLKTKCHTSPLPMNAVKGRDIDRTDCNTGSHAKTTIVNIKSNLDEIDFNSHDSRNNPIKTNISKRIKSTINSTSFNTTSNRSQVNPTIATNACRKPFVPPKKNGLDIYQSYSTVRKRPVSDQQKKVFSGLEKLESVIEGRSLQSNSFDTTPDATSGAHYPTYSSTQKCTMSEIEEKRKFAQQRLRERLHRRAKKIQPKHFM